MTNKRHPGARSGVRRSGRKSPPAATVPPRSDTQSDVESESREGVRYSPTGDPDQRRDDNIQPSPDGPLTGERSITDIEGVHEHRKTNVERE